MSSILCRLRHITGISGMCAYYWWRYVLKSHNFIYHIVDSTNNLTYLSSSYTRYN